MLGDKVSRFKLIRQEMGISQITLSIEAEIPRYKIQLADEGIRCINDAEARRLAQALGYSAEKMPFWISTLIKGATNG